MIDDVIDPRETRPTIIRALELAEGKRVERPWKRHARRAGVSAPLNDNGRRAPQPAALVPPLLEAAPCSS